VNTLQAQSIVRLVRHLEQSHITPEATLSTDVTYLLSEASKALGLVVDVNRGKVLAALAMLAGPS
jgi:hypothetical protein